MKAYLNYSIFLLLCMMSHLVQSQAADSREQIVNEIQWQLDSLQQTRKFPGATFAVIFPNEEIIKLSTGIADSLHHQKMRPEHRMLSGSNGKTLFIAAILALHEEGLFDLDDRIAKYISDEEWFEELPNSSSITMRMLMNHTSGLEEYYTLGDFMEILKNDPDRAWEPLENISYVLGKDPLFSAGEDWGYADTNYLLLGYIVEKISGKDLYQVVKDKVIRPYELNKTAPSIRRYFDALAVGYSGSFSPFPFEGAIAKDGKLVFNPQFEWTGGGFVSNVKDLATWAKGFYYFYGVSPKTRKEIREGVPAKTGTGHLYGLGVQIRPSEYGYSYGHSGWFPGYLTDAIYIPELDLALSIQFNTDDFKILKESPYSYLMRFAEVIAERYEGF
ncbi:beta-lactamase family protein [Gramella jeungdoensis]|uniref:Beta-lactamase family protein n=1 Tax=Gramella jeungdoensis TaxID=708091 RepID=A0ABT0YXC9_9FLAO|nr:serine hydrolase domain-containing protein [Gramella jeungdoensis]MCM8567984.1 beta-lactamase family protein [Gramella jeungdoensis]